MSAEEEGVTQEQEAACRGPFHTLWPGCPASAGVGGSVGFGKAVPLSSPLRRR